MGELSTDLAVALLSDTLWTAILLAAPLIGLATLVGVLVSVLQAVTQVQEMSLTFVPKLLTAAAVLLVFGGWMLTTLSQFAIRLIGGIPGYF
jgi:flagellar biosynthetic protein FliQ